MLCICMYVYIYTYIHIRIKGDVFKIQSDQHLQPFLFSIFALKTPSFDAQGQASQRLRVLEDGTGELEAGHNSHQQSQHMKSTRFPVMGHLRTKSRVVVGNSGNMIYKWGILHCQD